LKISFDSVTEKTFNRDGDTIKEITFNYQGLDYVWSGYPNSMGLTVNIYHETNHNTCLDCITISEPTKRSAISCIKDRIRDRE
jgi:hypothetical protein